MNDELGPVDLNDEEPYSLGFMRKSASSGNSDLLPAVPYDQHERELLAVIDERDHWHDKATELANDIGAALGFDVGEHSNLNCPVQAAIDGLFEMRAQIEEWRGR